MNVLERGHLDSSYSSSESLGSPFDKLWLYCS